MQMIADGLCVRVFSLKGFAITSAAPSIVNSAISNGCARAVVKITGISEVAVF